MKRTSMIIAVVLFLALGAGAARAQSGYDLFQQALVKERAEGNLEQAIGLYKRIVQEHAANRPLAAKALVEMGQCYEKLGKGEARKAYERVLREYADQEEMATQARTRLAALRPPATTVNASTKVARQLWAEPDTEIWHTATSSDGRYYVHVAWETGDLAVRDLTLGETRPLTDKGSWLESTEFALSSVLSPDDRQIAYTWFNKDLFFDLRIIGLDGSGPRVFYSNKEIDYPEPRAWTPDGKFVVATFGRQDGSTQIVLISVADGSVRPLKSFPWQNPMKVSLSPDGRYLVYDAQARQDSESRDILLLATDGSRETPLIEHPANDLFPIWTPDGNHVVFNSDRSGSMGAWMIEVVDGKRQGAPSLVKSDMTRSMPLAFTRKGSFVYGLEVGMQDVYVADVDLATGKLTAPAKKLSERYVGANRAAVWSPDGQYLAYVSTRAPMVTGGGWGSTVIVIRSLKTGEERELPLPVEGRRRQPRWSPDGRFFLVAGQIKNRSGLYRIAVQTGEVSTILQVVPGAYIQQADWSADGKAVFYKLNEPSHKGTRLLRRSLDTGEERELYRTDSPSFVEDLAPSPDGRSLALVTNDPATKSDVLMIMPASGGQLRELLRVKAPEYIAGPFAGLTWTPDGREIVFGRHGGAPKEVASVWLISPEGGQPRSLGLSMEGLSFLSFHPDRRRLAFSAGPLYRAEVWAMENFLPVPKAAK